MSEPTPPLPGLRRRLYSMDFLVLFMGLVAVLGLGVHAALRLTHSAASFPEDWRSWTFVGLTAAVALAGLFVAVRFVWERRHGVGVSWGTRFGWIDKATGAFVQESRVEALRPPPLVLHARTAAFLLLGASLVCACLASGSVIYAALFVVVLVVFARRSEDRMKHGTGATPPAADAQAPTAEPQVRD